MQEEIKLFIDNLIFPELYFAIVNTAAMNVISVIIIN